MTTRIDVANVRAISFMLSGALVIISAFGLSNLAMANDAHLANRVIVVPIHSIDPNLSAGTLGEWFSSTVGGHYNVAWSEGTHQ